jgi:hypothetical protein
LLAAGDVDNPHRMLFGAIVHNQLGDREAALNWLGRATKRVAAPSCAPGSNRQSS